MKKYLCFAFLAVFTFAGCSFTLLNSDTSSSPYNHNNVIDGKISGPFGDSDFIQLSKTAELTGKITVPSSGKTYYISPDGNDKNVGTRENPFKTFEKTLPKLEPGDTLYVMCGTRTTITEQKCTLKCNSTTKKDIELTNEDIDVNADFTGNIKIKDKNGKSDAWITITSDPKNTERPVIAVSSKAIISIKNSSYLRISGLNLWGSSGNGAEGIQFSSEYESNCNHIIIDNCDFKYINVQKESNNGHGITMRGSSKKYPINNILVYNNNFQYLLTGRSECVTAVGNCEYISIIGNKIDYTGNIGIDVGGHYKDCKDENGNLCKEKDFVRYVYIAKNTVSNELSAYDATAYAIYADGGQHIQIVNNTVTDCTGAFEVGAEEECGKYPTRDVLVKDNIVKNSITDQNLAPRCHVFQIGGWDGKGYVEQVKLEGNDIYIDAAISKAIVDFSHCNNITIVNNNFSATEKFKKGYVFGSRKYATSIVMTPNTINDKLKVNND